MPEKALPPGSFNLPRSVHALCGLPAASCRSPGCKLLTVRLLTAGRSCKGDSHRPLSVPERAWAGAGACYKSWGETRWSTAHAVAIWCCQWRAPPSAELKGPCRNRRKKSIFSSTVPKPAAFIRQRSMFDPWWFTSGMKTTLGEIGRSFNGPSTDRSQSGWSASRGEPLPESSSSCPLNLDRPVRKPHAERIDEEHHRRK